ncbi:hypothetical protein LG047_15195 [Methylocystis sp. WRRC1]|uniref:hypothetical protein n=1 Tax=Methylocystis sp. WRRC1 TaxID=1732014 RepID=UPI001D139994|nr:hypothetical protein [Methylocystis sp. WRRC1]MCC3246646.1 hypothetical protein [Methylocystis sp. WRRC1]
MESAKSLLQSKTFWANVVSAGCFLMAMFGKPVAVDQAATADLLSNLAAHGWEVAGIVSTLVSTVFRAVATKEIKGVVKAP